MAKIIFFIKRNTKLKDTLKICLAISYFPVIIYAWIYSLVSTRFPKNLWLIGELGVDAKDNGFVFFKYINKTHPEIKAVYYIKKDTPIYSEVSQVGETVEYNSFFHMIAFMKATKIISTQDMYPLPWGRINWREFKIVYPWIARKKEFVFLQHGITKDDASKNMNFVRTRFDYLVTSTKREFEEINSEKYDYPNGNVIETGMPRFDDLYNNLDKQTKNEILLMPTWRQYLADVSTDEFKASKYYNAFNNLFNNVELIKILRENNMVLSFFPPHQEIQKFLSEFKPLDKEVFRMIDVTKESVSNLISESKLMITDYSSVSFDFAYMKKPLIYFQFDLNEFRSKHYKEGYFSYEVDGFGPVVYDSDLLVIKISEIIKDNFKISDIFMERNNAFFDLRDNKNSERLFEIIK